MSKRWIKAGVTDQTIDVFIQDSTSTTGAGLTGLVFNTSGLTCYYRKGATGTPTALTLATQTVGGAHSDGGFVAVDGTNMPGVYRLDLSDTIVASAGMVTLYLRGAANMVPLPLEIEVVAADIYDGTRLGLTALPNVASGNAGAIITSGTNTAQLSVSNGQVTVATNNDKTGYELASSQTFSTTGSVGSVTGNVGGNVTGNVGGSVASIGAGGITSASFATGAIDSAAMNVNGSEFTAIPWNAAWDAEVQSEVQDAIEANHLDHLLAATYDPAAKPGVADSLFNDLVQDNGSGVSQFTTIALELAPSGGGGGTTDWTANERTAIRSILGIPTSGTTPTDPTAGILDTIRDTFPANFAALGINSSGHLSRVTLVDTCTTNTDMRGTDNAALAASWTATRAGYLDSVLIAANANQRTVQVNGNGHVASVLHSSEPDSITVGAFAADSITESALAASAATEIATATQTSAMTESYRAAGASPTLAQAMFELLAHMGDSSISGTTKTLKKIDGTTAKTFTLDSSTAPTSITEAT